jgi:hypothetical protein
MEFNGTTTKLSTRGVGVGRLHNLM